MNYLTYFVDYEFRLPRNVLPKHGRNEMELFLNWLIKEKRQNDQRLPDSQ